MAKHNEIVNNFKANIGEFDLTNKEQKYLVSNQLFFHPFSYWTRLTVKSILIVGH